jgi:hypothetical protein
MPSLLTAIEPMSMAPAPTPFAGSETPKLSANADQVGVAPVKSVLCHKPPPAEPR